MKDRAQRAIVECRHIATMSEEPGRITRRFLTPPMHEVHAHLLRRMEALGMTVHIDAAGNLRGLWQPPRSSSKRLMLGSHIDTIPDAGAFDGVLGVTLALEWVGLAQELGLRLRIEVIAFSEEEGMRYASPYLGSRAVAGDFDLKLLAEVDADGIRMDDAMRGFGLDPARIGEAALDAQSVLGFVEVHIEQGPVLEAEGLPLAVVEAITGQTRLGLRFKGQANHAGTTPMHLRRDALAAAAEWITAVEMQISEAARQSVPGLVATVGRIDAQPNAGNVVPGLVELGFEVRHMSTSVRHEWVKKLIKDAGAIAKRRNIEFEWEQKLDHDGVEMDFQLTARLQAAVEAAGFPVKTMPSGAGHDAMVMAARVPTSMLFLRSPGGISHHPSETVRNEDVEASLHVAREFLLRLGDEVR